jgi:hypothetical protein
MERLMRSKLLMDKKGLVGVVNIITLFVWIFVLTMLIMVQNGVPKEKALESINILNEMELHFEPITNTTSGVNPIIDVVYLTANYALDVIPVVALAAFEFGYSMLDHFNAKAIMYLLILSLAAPLIMPLVKLLIILGIFINEGRIKLKERRLKKKNHNTIKKEAQQPNGNVK